MRKSQWRGIRLEQRPRQELLRIGKKVPTRNRKRMPRPYLISLEFDHEACISPSAAGRRAARPSAPHIRDGTGGAVGPGEDTLRINQGMQSLTLRDANGKVM
jgi:hypothetical protein